MKKFKECKRCKNRYDMDVCFLCLWGERSKKISNIKINKKEIDTLIKKYGSHRLICLIKEIEKEQH